jgi:hypothetical protein
MSSHVIEGWVIAAAGTPQDSAPCGDPGESGMDGMILGTHAVKTYTEFGRIFEGICPFNYWHLQALAHKRFCAGVRQVRR